MSRDSGRILVADDTSGVREYVARLLRREGHVVRTVVDGGAALEEIAREVPDLVLSDVMMPNINGFELCRRLKANAGTRLVPVILITALGERHDRLEGISAGADDFLIKPFDPAQLAARVASLIRLKRIRDELDSAEGMILNLALTVEAREPYTAGHCGRMAAYAAAFGVHLKLDTEDVVALHRGGYLHDLGKIAVPDRILAKPGPLTPDEMEIMKRHPAVGEALCGQLRVLRGVRPIVRLHHERLDGSGYPDGLRGNDIPLLAQIMGIVDAYDAVTTERPYQAARTEEIAFAELRADAERGWRSMELVNEFVSVCRTGRLRMLMDAGADIVAANRIDV